MFLKRRDILSWILILLAAVLWALGQAMLLDISAELDPTTSPMESTIATTPSITEPTAEWMPTTEVTMDSADATYYPNADGTMPPDYRETAPNGRAWGFILCAAAAGMAIFGVFVLRQKTALLGPDGTALLLPLLLFMRESYTHLEFLLCYAGAAVVILTVCRELWGWVGARFSMSWCLIDRISKRCPSPQLSLLVFVIWIISMLAGIVYVVLQSFFRYGVIYGLDPLLLFCLSAAAFFGLACLWKYGADLDHFKKQLNNYQQGLPISVKDGAFAQTEAQLLEVQAQHEEAVRMAVTSERFKVELISNVSHDLRTPLTSILGYSELLQKQNLSPEGQEQLRRLHQKAGYMNDLVESLFELTKVSSGVIEAKKEEIDLVRLLEQTIGLYDDQLVVAGLCVRRHYDSDSIPIITDGARLHQVFANLLGNAIKYALKGTRIYLEVREVGENYRIRMVNTSSYEMDFKPEEIMQRFARGDKARSTKGSGLGLAIAQTYTESVGGTFRVAVDGDQFSAIVELPRN